MADIKDWKSLSEPNEEWQEAVDKQMGGKQPDLGLFPDIAALRTWITNAKLAMSDQMGPKIEGVKEEDHQVEMRDGHKITCRVHRPETAPSGGSPLVVIYHGGGWCIGGLENEELQCRLMVTKLGATCVNVDYRLGPEDKFPTAHNDCYDATKWASANASSLGADPSKGFIIGGTSAGGNITATISHQAKDEKWNPPITGALLIVPAYCYHKAFPEKYKSDFHAYEQNKDAPILTHGAMNLFLDNYIPKEEDRKNQLFSPMLWETGHAGLPPSYFQICGQDPLRDEALIFERIMREEEGIKTKVDVYPGLPHGYWSVMPTLKASEKFVEDSVEGVRWLLEQK